MIRLFALAFAVTLIVLYAPIVAVIFAMVALVHYWPKGAK